MVVHLFTNAIALDWEIDFITNQTYYHEDYYGEGAYGSSLPVFAAFFGLYKCDKIRRFNRMKYIHRILASGSVLLICFSATWCTISFFYFTTIIPETPNDNTFNIISFWIWPAEIACLFCLLLHSLVSASLSGTCCCRPSKCCGWNEVDDAQQETVNSYVNEAITIRKKPYTVEV